VAEPLAHSGYDWLLVTPKYGTTGYETLSGISQEALLRVAGYHADRAALA
jgi:hypothetical protein